MANYELMLIIDPSLSEKDRTTTIDSLKELMKKYSIKVEKEDIW
jgi:ribosomal protein S6